MSFGAGGSDVCVIKTDAFGDTLWTKVDGTALNDSINGGLYAQQTSDGGYIISGYIVTDYNDSLGEFTTDIYVIKTDSNGNVYCGKNFNSTNTLVNNTSTQVVKSTSSSIVSTGSSVKKTSTLIGNTSTLINNLTNDGPVQPICLITVDSTSTKNVIVWEKPVTAGIDRFKIYREITTNNYQHIGSVAYSDLSVFSDNDPDINPNTTMPTKPVVRAFQTRKIFKT